MGVPINKENIYEVLTTDYKRITLTELKLFYNN